jgi:hypothetical protein
MLLLNECLLLLAYISLSTQSENFWIRLRMLISYRLQYGLEPEPIYIEVTKLQRMCVL